MSELKGKIDDFVLIKDKALLLLNWLSATAFRRIAFLSLFSLSVFGLTYLYINDLANKSASDIEDKYKRLEEIYDTNRYASTIDSIDLCLNARDDNKQLGEWYCAHALQLYKKISSENAIPFSEEIIEKKAYGAMKVEINREIRHMKYKELLNKESSAEYVLLTNLVSDVGIFLYLTVAFILFIFIVFLLYGRRNSSP